MAEKYNWTDTEIAFIKDNFNGMTAKQMLQAFNGKIKLHTLRMKYYELGLKKMEMEYWDEYQLAFLFNNYKQMGDKEIAEIFNAVCPKQKPWTLKHIEKKREYLELKRTKAELKAIKQRNKEFGCWIEASKKTWETRGQASEGTIRLWNRQNKPIPYIKVDGRFIHWTRWAWEKHYGPIPKGMNVVYKHYSIDKLTEINNLELITDAGLAKRNSIHDLPKEIVSLIYLRTSLNRKINKHRKRLSNEK